MSHRVVIDITERDKVFINPNNGVQITKLKGGVEISGSSPHQTGPDRGSTSESSGQERKTEEKELENVPVEDTLVEPEMTFQVEMTAKEHEAYIRYKVEQEKKDA